MKSAAQEEVAATCLAKEVKESLGGGGLDTRDTPWRQDTGMWLEREPTVD